MKKLSTVKYKDINLDIIDQNGVPWLSGKQIGVALGYEERHRDAVNQIYLRNKDEFTDELTQITRHRQIDGGKKATRIYSPKGAWLLGMFSRTKESKVFRKWVLDVLEKHVEKPKIPEHRQLEWQTARADGKVIRKAETDTIKKFVTYSSGQGSSSPQMYYVAITSMVNRALFSNINDVRKTVAGKINIREHLNHMQLTYAKVSDNLVATTLEEGMELDVFYKDIYQLAKEKVEAFAKVIGMTPVLPEEPKDLQLTA